MRQAAFKGVREDKPAKEVVRELAGRGGGAAPEEPQRAAATVVEHRSPRNRSPRRSRRPRQARRRDARARPPPRTVPRTKAASASPIRIASTGPDAGVTKQDLADYYSVGVGPDGAASSSNVPLSLLRCPDGTKGECFFQKHASAGLNDALLRSVIDSKRRQVIAVENLDGLLSLVQAGVLEVHVRGSTIDRLDLCDRIVFDIDPGAGVGWADIVRAAREVRERLEAIDLESFVKLSGGKGVHVVLPVAPVDWETVKTFVQAFAQAMAADDPERYVAKMTKSLRKGKIFVDYFRNSLEQTSVAAYSTRARDGAPVSAPVTWEELGRVKSANQYTLLNLGKRLVRMKRDPWADIGRVKQKLPDLRVAAEAEAELVALLRQRDELALVAGHGVEAAGLPVGLGLLDAVLARGDEIPPDVARAVHRGAADQHDAGVGRRRHGDGVAGTEDQQPARARICRRRCRSRRRPRRARALRSWRRTASSRRPRASPRRTACPTRSAPASARRAGCPRPRARVLPLSVTIGSSALPTCAKPGSVSSSLAGSATQHCKPCSGSPPMRRSGAVRSECTMPRPAVIQLTSPGRIGTAVPRLSRCMISPSNRKVTVASPICGCGRTSMPWPLRNSAGPK